VDTRGIGAVLDKCGRFNHYVHVPRNGLSVHRPNGVLILHCTHKRRKKFAREVHLGVTFGFLFFFFFFVVVVFCTDGQKRMRGKCDGRCGMGTRYNDRCAG
jgi:hypothetical protein